MKKRHREQLGYIWSYPYRHSLLGGWKHHKVFDAVASYVLFVGYPRSGHSLIGSLLDAHPNMVISNQLDALSLFAHNYSRRQIYFLIWENTLKEQAAGRSNSGYNYQVPNQWQGRSKDILVIGDKRGGKSSRILADKSKINLLARIPEVTKIPLKMIHVIRNPFDNVSTMVARGMERRGVPFSEALYREKLTVYLGKAAVNAGLMQNEQLNMFNLHLEDFIGAPKRYLSDLCGFLGVEAIPAYLEDCASILWKEPNRSRFKSTIWTAERIEELTEKKNQYDFLKGYTFE